MPFRRDQCSAVPWPCFSPPSFGFRCLVPKLKQTVRLAPYHCLSYPVDNSFPRCRHFGSLSTVLSVMPRNFRITVPKTPLIPVETLLPGASSMKGMNLSGNPGIVQPMQIPPTFGQPPMPLIQPRLGTLHLTTGPQQPSLTMHLGEPYSVAKSPSS